MINIESSNNITQANVSSKGNQGSVSANNNPLLALCLNARDSAKKAEDNALLASAKVDEINNTATEIQNSLNLTQAEILNSILIQQSETIDAVNEAGTIQIQVVTEKVNEILDLNPADVNLSNITASGITTIKAKALEALSEPLSKKLNKEDIKAYITETYVNGLSGYRIWSDRFCEQWGSITTTNLTTTVTFLKNFKDTNYFATSILAMQSGTVNTNCASYIGVVTKTLSGCTLINSTRDVGQSGFIMQWYARGYID